MYNLKRRIFEVIEEDITDSWVHKAFEGLIITLVILNVVAIILGSILGDKVYLENFEIFSVTIFTLDYILGLWTAPLKYRHKVKKFSLGFMKLPHQQKGCINHSLY